MFQSNEKSRNVCVTGVGMITPQGLSATETFDNLIAGRVLLNTGYVTLDADGNDRVTQLAAVAANEAMADAGWMANDLVGNRTALIVGTSKGPIERWIHEINGGAARPLHGLSDVAADLTALLQIRPEFRLTYSAACASGLHAAIRGAALIRGGQCDRVLVVAAESSLSDLFQATFQRLGVLAPPGYGCRPFDQQRRGFTLSEAAAAVCLEYRPRPAGIVIEHAMMLADAHHLTATDPDAGALRHMLAHLRRGGPIDFIHAHGTGTELNDPAELLAIDTLPATDAPLVYSHKAAIGHTQGAAGLLSLVINALVHTKSIAPPNAATNQPLPTRSANIIAHAIPHACTHSIALAAGFGGSIAGITLNSIVPPNNNRSG